MKFEDWYQRVLEAISDLADEQQQRALWFSANASEVSSPVEEVCRLVDDLLLKDFIVEARERLGPDAESALAALLTSIDALGTLLEGSVDPNDVIDDPKWTSVRRAAAKAKLALERGSSSKP